MSTLAVARKDFRASRRTKTLWGVALILTAIAGLFAWTYSAPSELTTTEAMQQLFSRLVILTSIIVPIVALIASYLAIAGERDSGGIKFLLALPNSRREVFVGKLLSRLTTVALGLAVMFAGSTVIVLYKHGTIPVGTLAGLMAVFTLYSSVFVGVAVSMSSLFASRSRAIGGAIAVYFFSVVIYFVPLIRISEIVKYVHTELLGQSVNHDLYNVIEFTSPLFAFQKAKNLVLPREMHTYMFEESMANAEKVFSDAQAAPELPFYLTNEFAFVILAAWLVIPLALGYVRFKRADIA